MRRVDFLSAGFDFRQVDGDSRRGGHGHGDRLRRSPRRGCPVARSAATARSSRTCLHRPTGCRFTLSLRVDNWKNYDGHNLETTVATGQPVPPGQPAASRIGDQTEFSGQERHVVSSARRGDVPDQRHVSVWGSSSGGFRAPTLNELYRQFRVGALLVLANNQLGPENLVERRGRRQRPSRPRMSRFEAPGTSTALRTLCRT